MKHLQLQAPAKLNLFLDVLGKRPDGYHTLKSVVVPVSLFDTITLEDRPQGIETLAPERLELPGLDWPLELCPAADNLVTRAAQRLRDATGYRGGARIVLEKHIPIGAGLGGGSSDAAAVLAGLNRLWGLGLGQDRLRVLGASLGCDIPAFLCGGALCMEGVGELLTPLGRAEPEPRPLQFLLVYPGFAVSTRDIYARFNSDLTHGGPGDRFSRVVSGLEQGSAERVADGLYNALRPTVLQKYPVLEQFKKYLEAAGALGVELTGSGSTLFALVRDDQQGADLEARFRREAGSPAWTCRVHTLGAVGAA